MTVCTSGSGQRVVRPPRVQSQGAVVRPDAAGGLLPQRGRRCRCPRGRSDRTRRPARPSRARAAGRSRPAARSTRSGRRACACSRSCRCARHPATGRTPGCRGPGRPRAMPPVSRERADLLALYAVRSPRSRRPAPLARLTTRPPPPSIMCGMLARLIRNGPRTLTVMVRHHCSTSASHSGTSGSMTPALLTRTSSRPKASSTAPTQSSTSAGSVTSARCTRIRPPAAVTSRSRVARAPVSRPTAATA